MRTAARLGSASIVVVLMVTLAGCSGSSSSSEPGTDGDVKNRPRAAIVLDSVSSQSRPATSDVAVDGREWRITANSSKALAGPVDFTFTNDGTQVHEMIVVRTDAPLGALTVDPTTQRIDENDPSIEIIDEIPEVEAGDTGSATIDLEAGRYQVICNLAGHYSNGMRMQLTVE